MTELKNIYDVLEEMDIENKCEKYALGFQRDTDTPTMTKFRQESAKQFTFSLIQEFYERALGDLSDTKKKLDIAVDALKWIDETYELGQELETDIRAKCQYALEQIKEQ